MQILIAPLRSSKSKINAYIAIRYCNWSFFEWLSFTIATKQQSNIWLHSIYKNRTETNQSAINMPVHGKNSTTPWSLNWILQFVRPTIPAKRTGKIITLQTEVNWNAQHHYRLWTQQLHWYCITKRYRTKASFIELSTPALNSDIKLCSNGVALACILCCGKHFPSIKIVFLACQFKYGFGLSSLRWYKEN